MTTSTRFSETRFLEKNALDFLLVFLHAGVGNWKNFPLDVGTEKMRENIMKRKHKK